jgi:hypothetical protein
MPSQIAGDEAARLVAGARSDTLGVMTTRTSHLGRMVAAVALAVALFAAPRPAAGQPAREPARLRFSAALLDELFSRLVPAPLAVPVAAAPDGGSAATSETLTLVELRYCGQGARGAAGRLRAVVRAGGGERGAAGASRAAADAGSARVLEAAGCTTELDRLARRAAAVLGDAAAVADVEASYRPYELRVAVVRAAAAKRTSPALAILSRAAGPLLSLATAPIVLGGPGGQPLGFRVGVGFGDEAVELRAVPDDGGPGPAAGAGGGGVASVASAGSGATVAADLPHQLANQILARVSRPGPFVVELDRETVELRDLAISGNGAGVSIIGLGTPRSVRETARMSVDAGGRDLAIESVRAEPELESCSTRPLLDRLACGGRNTARSAAASALAASLTHRYQGQLVRVLAGVQELALDLPGYRLALSGDILRIGPTSTGITIAARLAATLTAR